MKLLPKTVRRKVVVYTTHWCGYCRATKVYLRSKNIPFIEKDIEVDGAARAALIRRTGTYRGVPVLDIDGTIILGFDRPAIDEVLAGHSARKST